MGLNASVFCDCYETGKMRLPAPQPELLYMDESGQLYLDWKNPKADLNAFYDWLSIACEHGPLGQIVSHRLGNIASIGYLRNLLSDRADRFPILLTKVLYNGIHGGDFLSLTDVDLVAQEIDRFTSVHVSSKEYETMVREFETQMRELIEVSRRLRKPIVF